MVKVRSNIPFRLSKELAGLDGTIGIGTVTDPYQYAEKRFKITQKCLILLKQKDFRIHLHTKSDLVLRDMEMLASMRGEVGITITSVEDKFSKITEPGAPLPAKRIDALKQLTAAGIDTYALIGPVLNHLEGKEEEFVNAIASTGVKRAYIDGLNSRPLLTERLNRMNIRGSESSKEKIRLLAVAQGIVVKDVF